MARSTARESIGIKPQDSQTTNQLTHDGVNTETETIDDVERIHESDWPNARALPLTLLCLGTCNNAFPPCVGSPMNGKQLVLNEDDRLGWCSRFLRIWRSR